MSPALLLRPSLFSVVPADIPDEIDGQQNDCGHNGDDVNSYFHRKTSLLLGVAFRPVNGIITPAAAEIKHKL